MAPPARSRRARRFLLHAVRVAVFATVLMQMHLQASRRAARRANESLAPVALSQLQVFYPEAASSGELFTEGGVAVFDDAHRQLGYCLQTSPDSDRLIGFSGPTNVLIALDDNDRIRGLGILASQDTKEHVQQVIDDGQLLQAFNGLTRQEALGKTDVDAVTGATLTSLAIYESVLHCLGRKAPSLRFPDPPTLREVQSLFPQAIAIEQDASAVPPWKVYGRNGEELGSFVRTSPAADHLIGYQGPTETLIGFGTDGRVTAIALRHSYDNRPYVTYVREDSYFLNSFEGLTLAELAELDLQAAEVEGVSGATMTSLAVAKGVVLAAGDLIRSERQPIRERQIRWSLRDLGTAAMILAGCILGFTSLRSVRWLRVGFQWLLVGYLGLVNGDMISQAMIAGWAQHGIPWRTAGGLLLLTLVAFLVPLTTRRNIYCTHLCPHGAAQKLLRNRLGWRLRISPAVLRLLKMFPGLLLAWCVAVVLLTLPMSLVDFEPFDAWVFYVAGWATITVAVVGLVASLFVPMAYCRFGCPTGALLGFLRFHSRSDRWSTRDWVAVGLLLLGFGWGMFDVRLLI
ncbi:MAG: FMN-binding protein [Planctomycetes bacterium]|nr:FMN-binding protein [Planctomycetota bacterium]